MPALWRPPSVQGQTRFTKILTLAAVPSAAGAARRYARNELVRASLLALTENAELVVSELVTNAVVATGVMTADPKWAELEGLAVIRIRLGFSATNVCIEVWDREAAVPAQKQAANDEEGGRGLLIVSVLCTRWGVRPTAAGKVGVVPLFHAPLRSKLIVIRNMRLPRTLCRIAVSQLDLGRG